MSNEQQTPNRMIGVTWKDFTDIIDGETTIGFKYDGIGCVFGMLPSFGAILLNIFLYPSKYMLVHAIVCLLAALIFVPISIHLKDFETFLLRRYLAIVAPPMLALVWFLSGGLHSATGYLYMLGIVSYNSFLVTGKKGKWYVSYAIAVNAAAMLLSYFCPQLSLPVGNEQHLLWYNFSLVILIAAYIGLTTWFQRKIAENMQDKLAEANEEQKAMNEELIALNENLQKLNEEIKEHMQRQMEMKLEEEKLRHQKEQAEETTLLLVQTLSNTIETRDEYLRGHSRRVSEYSVLIARKMGLPEDRIEKIRVAASLHDIGKIGVSDLILNKPARLTGEEYNMIKNHTCIGSDLLKTIDIIAYTSDIARHHHERYDGKGYPDGLIGDENSLDARIVAVADSFDAMNSKRVYRNPLDREIIRSEILKNKGTQFDPDAADAFLDLYDSGVIDQVVK